MSQDKGQQQHQQNDARAACQRRGEVAAEKLIEGLLAYSRIPLVLARDRLLPRWFAVTDERGTPRRAVLLSAVAYSLFVLQSFGGLLAADVLLFTAALAMEFAALIRLRRTEPGLRSATSDAVMRRAWQPHRSGAALAGTTSLLTAV